jgi:hypothetical protein
MRWAGHLACTGEMRNANKILEQNLKGSDHLGDTGVDGG